MHNVTADARAGKRTDIDLQKTDTGDQQHHQPLVALVLDEGDLDVVRHGLRLMRLVRRFDRDASALLLRLDRGRRCSQGVA